MNNEDKTVVKWLTVMTAGLAVVAIALLIGSMMIASAVAATSPFDEIEERLRPVGRVVVAAPPQDENDESEPPAAEEDVADEESVSAAEPEPEPAPAETVAADAEPPAAAANGLQIPAEFDAAAGQSIYASACSVCHAQGIAGAPVSGDASQWNERLAKGWDALAQNSLGGIGAMPPKGGRMDLSDQDILNAMAYMIEQVR